MRRVTTTNRQRGFGIVEILVATVLVGILLAGLVELFVSTQENYSAANNLSQLQETGRAAVELVAADIRRAGFLGGNSDITTVFGTAGVAASAGTCATADTSWGRMLGQSVHGLNDGNGGYACVADAEYLRGDILTTRMASPWTVAAGSMGAQRLYVRSSLFEGKVFAGQDQANTQNQVVDDTAQNYELQSHAWFVGRSARSCDGAAIPALYRKALGPTGLPVSQELLTGVEQMQFRYMQDNR